MSSIAPFRKSVVRFLVTNDSSLLGDWQESDWTRQFYWLDRSGLVLPVATRLLKDADSSSRTPDSVLQALEKRLKDNDRRMSAMLGLQESIQSGLTVAGVRFCCLKGFSLVPDCYGSIRERHQVDFDFLLDPCEVHHAAEALRPLNYRPAQANSSGETRLVRPWKKHLTAASWQYQVSEGPAIELHTHLWEPQSEFVDFSLPGGWLEQIQIRTVQGLDIPCLSPAWQVLHLLLHVFRHLLDSWVRLLSVFEIAVILRNQQSNEELWQEVRRLIEQDARLASACALVLSIVSAEFQVSLPAALAELCGSHLSKESALWVEHFREEWLYADPPGTKLSLLVQRQFCRDHAVWRSYSLRRLFPLRTPHSLSEESSGTGRLKIRYAMDAARYQIGRLGYHLVSDWKYLLSIARWRRLGDSSQVVPLSSS